MQPTQLCTEVQSWSTPQATWFCPHWSSDDIHDRPYRYPCHESSIVVSHNPPLFTRRVRPHLTSAGCGCLGNQWIPGGLLHGTVYNFNMGTKSLQKFFHSVKQINMQNGIMQPTPSEAFVPRLPPEWLWDSHPKQVSKCMNTITLYNDVCMPVSNHLVNTKQFKNECQKRSGSSHKRPTQCIAYVTLICTIPRVTLIEQYMGSSYYTRLETTVKSCYAEKLMSVGLFIEDDPFLPKNGSRFADM